MRLNGTWTNEWSSVSDTKRLHDSSLFSASTGLIWNTLRESVILERLDIRFTSSTMTSSSSASTILSFQKGDLHRYWSATKNWHSDLPTVFRAFGPKR